MNIFYHLNRCFSCRFDVKLLNAPSMEKTTETEFDLADATPALTNPSNGAITIANPNSAECEIFHLDNFLKQYNKYTFTNGIHPCDYLVTVKNNALLFVELTECIDINKAIKDKKTGNVIFAGGKNEKAQTQLETTLCLFMSDPCFQQAASAYPQKKCIFGYKIRTAPGPAGVKAPSTFSRNRVIASQLTQNKGEQLSNPAIESLGFNLYRIAHPYKIQI